MLTLILKKPILFLKSEEIKCMILIVGVHREAHTNYLFHMQILFQFPGLGQKLYYLCFYGFAVHRKIAFLRKLTLSSLNYERFINYLMD